MSWSVNYFGSPKKIAEALDAESGRLTGQCKEEFDASLPHIKGLLEQNFGETEPLLSLSANGSGFAKDGEQKQRQATVTLTQLYTKVLVCMLLAVSLMLLPSIAQAGPLRCMAGAACRAASTIKLPRSDVRQSRRAERRGQ